MAGANNAQFKAQGWRAKDITKARAERGKLTSALMTGMGFKRKGEARVGAPPGWQAAARGERRQAPAPANPALERMRQAKANLPALREARDERRQRMTTLRQRVEFNRETKQISKALESPDMRAAMRRADDGYGPKQARESAKRLTRSAIVEVKAARKAMALARDSESGTKARVDAMVAGEAKRRRYSDETIARVQEYRLGEASKRSAPVAESNRQEAAARLANARRFREAAKKERRHATLVERGDALRAIAEEPNRASRRLAKQEYRYSSSWLKG